MATSEPDQWDCSQALAEWFDFVPQCTRAHLEAVLVAHGYEPFTGTAVGQNIIWVKYGAAGENNKYINVPQYDWIPRPATIRIAAQTNIPLEAFAEAAAAVPPDAEG